MHNSAGQYARFAPAYSILFLSKEERYTQYRLQKMEEKWGFMIRRLFKGLDCCFMLVVVILLGLDLLVMSSASASTPLGAAYYVERQTMWIVLGLITAAIIIFAFDYSKLQYRWHHVIYAVMVVMLAAILLAGHGINGAQRSFQISGVGSLQPSEFAKIMIIVCFAFYLSRKQAELRTLKDLAPCFLYFAAPFVLIFKQPDLGTSLVFIIILFGMLYLAGVRPLLLLELLGVGLAIVILAITLHYSPLHLPLPMKDYQLNRLVSFVNPNSDPLGTGYHTIQSLVAVGSGGLWGKGLYHGSQIQLGFLPEQNTDFIFSVIGEEFGFLGAGVLLLLYYCLISRTLTIAFQARDIFGRLIVGGIFCMWLFHILENIGMAIGIMPVAGIPLPFMSYGGSSMLTNMIAVGLVMSVNNISKKEQLMFT
jgi:rod shape determining protein RodA